MHDESQVETEGLARFLPDGLMPGHEVTVPPTPGLSTVVSAFELNQARGLTPLGIGTSSLFRDALRALDGIGCRHQTALWLRGTSFARPMSTPWVPGRRNPWGQHVKRASHHQATHARGEIPRALKKG